MKFSFLILSLVYLNSAFAETSGATKIQLALNWKPEPEFGGFYQAKASGAFAKAGLEVEILPGGAGQPVAQMLAAKKVQWGIVAADELILARSRGAKIVALFAVYQRNPQGFMVRAERPIQSLKELFQSKGTIALQKGLPYTLWIEKQYAPIQAKLVPYTGGIASFIRDAEFSQQCFIFSEPIAAKRAKVAAKTFMIEESGFNPYLAVVAVHEDTLKSAGASVQQWVEALQSGWREYLDQPARTNQAMQKLNSSLDLETFQEGAIAQKPFIETEETKKSGLGVMTEARWAQLYEQLQSLKLVKAGMNPSDFFWKPSRLETPASKKSVSKKSP